MQNQIKFAKVHLSTVRFKAHFDILNCLGVTHESDGWRNIPTNICCAQAYYVARQKLPHVQNQVLFGPACSYVYTCIWLGSN